LAARPGQAHLPGVVAHIGVTCDGVRHILTEIIAVNVVDNDVAKLNFDRLTIADSTGGWRNQRAVKSNVVNRGLRQASKTVN
jgi:hypothetical protein